MKLIHRCFMVSCFALLACCSAGSAVSKAAIELKHTYKSLGYSRHDASQYVANVRRLINKTFDREFKEHATEVLPESLSLMIQEGSCNVFTEEDIATASKASIAKADELNKLFIGGQLHRKDWIRLRIEIRDFVFSWLTAWLKKQNAVEFNIRVMKATGEMHSDDDARGIATTDEVAPAFVLSNSFSVLAEPDAEDVALDEEEDVLRSNGVDAEIDEEEVAEESEDNVARTPPPAYLRHSTIFDVLADYSGDEELNATDAPKAPAVDHEALTIVQAEVVVPVAPVRAATPMQVVQPIPQWAGNNPFGVLSLFD